MRLGEGSAAALAVPILKAAAACHNGMATFAQAGVSSTRLRLSRRQTLPSKEAVFPGWHAACSTARAYILSCAGAFDGYRRVHPDREQRLADLDTSPQYMPTFDLNKQIVQKAEHYGLDFALSMIKLRGFGGKSGSGTTISSRSRLMADWPPSPKRIQLYASVRCDDSAAHRGRMASTIDSISGGRFGINIVSGWAKAEYEQMGLWPGEAHFAKRYDYSTEYVTILRELWENGTSDFKGDTSRCRTAS